ncbi:hypothetical protein [Streptomyces yangpuensis]|uniref:hypothetical protein n=1 Tax=Streptomyces yangpuensis TaxID=1648182 RepID=UPI0037168BF8
MPRRTASPAQRLGRLVTVLGQGLCLPPLHEHLHLADPCGELPVLRLHGRHLLGIDVQIAAGPARASGSPRPAAVT